MSSDLVVQQTFFNGTLAAAEGDEVHFRGCEFSHVKFESGVDAVFEHCRFEACDFSNANLSRASMLGSKFDGCVFVSVNFDEAQFIECDLKDPDFVNCKMYGIRFVGTDLSGASLGGCDARFAEFSELGLSDASLDDADFSDADLIYTWGMTDAQLTLANGNVRTALPEGITRPDDWFLEEEELDVSNSIDGIPGQLSAPLRVTWRRDRLVPEARCEKEEWKNPSLIVIFKSLREDVNSFLDQSPTNHPVARQIKALSSALRAGISGLNPVAIGYNVELIKAQLPGIEDELSASTAGSVRAIATGGELLASQYGAWQEVAANRDALASEQTKLAEAAAALQSIATSMRNMPNLFDRRVSDAVEEQAEDIQAPIGNMRIQSAVARSGGNVLSALAGKLLSIIKSGAKTAAQQFLKELISTFFRINEASILALADWAPSTVGWVVEFLKRHLDQT